MPLKLRDLWKKFAQDSRELSVNIQNIPDAATDEGSTCNSRVTSLVPHPSVFSFSFSARKMSSKIIMNCSTFIGLLKNMGRYSRHRTSQLSLDLSKDFFNNLGL